MHANESNTSLTTEKLPGSIETDDSLETSIASFINPFSECHGVRDIVDPGLPSVMSSALDHTLDYDNSQTWMIRQYRSEADLINAYYIFIHPYLPLLPPPVEPRFADCPSRVTLTNLQPDPQSLPFWPTSPFALALMAIFVLIPPSEDLYPMHKDATALRSSCARMYSKAALESIDKFTKDMEQVACQISNNSIQQGQQSCLHRDVPSSLEPVLALLLLGVYEYCQLGDKKQMRSRVYQALTTSMDLSLHIVGARNCEYAAAKTRAWWMTMYLAYQSAIFNHSTPILLMYDARINTPFPEFSGCRQLFPALMRAQDALLTAGAIARGLRDDKTTGSYGLIRESVRELDSLILTLAGDLERLQGMKRPEGADAATVHNLWLKARILTYTARTKLHRFRAFGDYPIFTKKFCDLNSINSDESSDFFFRSPPALLADINLVFPFTEQESTNICLKAALVLSRVLRHLRWPNPSHDDVSPGNKLPGAVQDRTAMCAPSTTLCRYPRSLPYLACAGVQSCYVLIMSLQKIRASLCAGNLATCHNLLVHPEPGTEQQDAERLIEELRYGVKSVRDFMSSNAIFKSVASMAREVETIYDGQFHDLSL